MLLLLSLLVALSVAQDLHGYTYQNKTRFEKVKMVWPLISRDTTSNDWYNTFTMSELFIESMNTSFNTPNDDMPKQFIGDLFTRKKLVHTVGVHLLMKLEMDKGSHNYTGLFKSGVDSAILRFSAAAVPETKAGSYSLTPGIAIKAFRDKRPSGNLFAMFTLTGQPSFNFFKHDLTNHPPEIGDWAPLPLRLLGTKFRTASAWPTMIGLNDWARYDQNGNNEPNPIFPYRLVFHPTTKLHNFLPDTYRGAFTDGVVQAVGAQAGGDLYYVYAQDAPGSQLKKIGTISALSAPTTSMFGDKTLFFQHTQMEGDFRLRPEWLSAANAEVANQIRTEGYQFPDLPWN